MEDNLLAEMSEGFLIIYTMYQEEKIASYQSNNNRYQLLKLTDSYNSGLEKYQIRINRKVLVTTIWRSTVEKKFASLITEDLLQQRFNF